MKGSCLLSSGKPCEDGHMHVYSVRVVRLSTSCYGALIFVSDLFFRLHAFHQGCVLVNKGYGRVQNLATERLRSQKKNPHFECEFSVVFYDLPETTEPVYRVCIGF